MFAAVLGGLAARFLPRAPLIQRTTRALTTRKETILRMAKGYRGRSKNCWRLARQRVEKALQYSYISRRLKKRARGARRLAFGARARPAGGARPARAHPRHTPPRPYLRAHR